MARERERVGGKEFNGISCMCGRTRGNNGITNDKETKNRRHIEIQCKKPSTTEMEIKRN